LQDFEYPACLFVGVSDFELIGKDALQSEILVVLQYRICCVCFVQTCKAKQGFGYVELDEIREVTPTRQNCDQTQLKRLKGVNIDVFN
jgi:hypothetical protein